MAGSDHDAGRRVQIADGKADHWRGAQGVEQVNLHARGRVYQRGFHGEFAGTNAGIVANHHAGLLILNRVRDAQRSAAHHIFVHAVGTRAQHAAQAACAKGEVCAKPFFDFCFRQVLHFFQERIVVYILKPTFILCACIHVHLPPVP